MSETKSTGYAWNLGISESQILAGTKYLSHGLTQAGKPSQEEIVSPYSLAVSSTLIFHVFNISQLSVPSALPPEYELRHVKISWSGSSPFSSQYSSPIKLVANHPKGLRTSSFFSPPTAPGQESMKFPFWIVTPKLTLENSGVFLLTLEVKASLDAVEYEWRVDPEVFVGEEENPKPDR